MSRQTEHTFASLIGEVVVGPPKFEVGRAYSSVRIEICNTMRVPVFWKNALGVVVTEPSFASMTEDEVFKITIEYEFHAGVKIDTRALLTELGLPDDKSVEKKGVYEALKALESTPNWQRQRKFHYTLGIRREQLEKLGGVVYLNDVDLVVGFEKYRDDVIHPFTDVGQTERVNNAIDLQAGFQQRYLLVDNSGVFGPRWVNTGYGVFELKPIIDSQLRDGVYVTVASGREKKPETLHYVFDNADKELGLYRTKAEAEAYGAPDTRYHAEIKDMERDLAHAKLELQRHRQEMEHEKAEIEADRRRHEELYKQEDHRRQINRDEIERQREQLKLDRDRFEFERQTLNDRHKFDYEMASRDRKDRSESVKGTVEIVKAVVSLVSLALTAYIAISKSKK